jgi:hypothetical protein
VSGGRVVGAWSFAVTLPAGGWSGRMYSMQIEKSTKFITDPVCARKREPHRPEHRQLDAGIHSFDNGLEEFFSSLLLLFVLRFRVDIVANANTIAIAPEKILRP